MTTTQLRPIAAIESNLAEAVQQVLATAEVHKEAQRVHDDLAAELHRARLAGLIERGAVAWAGVDAQALRDGGAELPAIPPEALSAPSGEAVAWLCKLMQEDGSVREMIVTEDPAGLRFNDIGEPSPFSVTPLYAGTAPAAQAAETAAMASVAIIDSPETGYPSRVIAGQHVPCAHDGRVHPDVMPATAPVAGLASPRDDYDDGDSFAGMCTAPQAVPAQEAAGDDWQHLKPHGYAPGDYMSKCHRCGQVATGLDKRAVTCRPCAEVLHAARTASPAPAVPAEPDRAWLVEWRWNGVQWLYLIGRRFSFTADPNAALRFARRADAEAALAWVEAHDGTGAPRRLGEMLATEHEWVAATPQEAPAPRALTDAEIEVVYKAAAKAMNYCAPSHPVIARAAIAEFCRVNSIPAPAARERE